MEIRPVREDELAEVADWVASQQADPTRHIASEAMDADAIATSFRELEPNGLADLLVAVDGHGLAGVLGLEHDREPPRVWWRGPYVAVDRNVDVVADALLTAGRGQLPAHVTQEEFAPDDRHGWLAAFAERHGFVPEEASAVLVRDLADGAGALSVAADPDGVVIAPVSPATAAGVVALHDAIFPGTHASGSRIASDRDGAAVLVATRGVEVIGYVAIEQQEDATGYIDYLGVTTRERGRGIGRALVAAACVELVDRWACPSANLTVRESNRAARRLYDSLGFEEERLVRPYRRGFTLDHLGSSGAVDHG